MKNNITTHFFVQYKKIIIYLFPLYRMKKKKKLHYWVVLGAEPNSNWSNRTQPTLLGPSVNRTQKIRSCYNYLATL
jgi:hypothetical protein